VISHSVVASDYRTDCHQAFSFNKILLLFNKKSLMAFIHYSQCSKVIDVCCFQDEESLRSHKC